MFAVCNNLDVAATSLLSFYGTPLICQNEADQKRTVNALVTMKVLSPQKTISLPLLPLEYLIKNNMKTQTDNIPALSREIQIAMYVMPVLEHESKRRTLNQSPLFYLACTGNVAAVEHHFELMALIDSSSYLPSQKDSFPYLSPESDYSMIRLHCLYRVMKKKEITPIQRAVINGDEEKVSQLLLEKKENAGSILNDWTLLQLAVFLGHLNIARILLSHGANPSIETSYGINSFFFSFFHSFFVFFFTSFHT